MLMESVRDGLNSPRSEFAKVGAWPESVGRGGSAGAFNTAVVNPNHHANAGMPAKDMARQGMATSKFSYTSLS